MSNTTSPRLVALDLDGTLLNHQGQVTPRTRQAIAEAVARGIVVLCYLNGILSRYLNGL